MEISGHLTVQKPKIAQRPEKFLYSTDFLLKNVKVTPGKLSSCISSYWAEE